MIKKIFSICAISFLAIPLVVSAAVFEGGQNYNLAKTQTLSENAYLAGSNVTLLGNAKEEVFAAGGNIMILGSVAKDVVAAGGTINISGDTGQNLRLAGGTITVAGNVGAELLAVGGQIYVLPGAQIQGDTNIFGGSLEAGGIFKKNVRLEGGTVTLSGQISGNVAVRASKEVIVTKEAVISGNFDYSAPNVATIDSEAKISGKTNFAKYVPKSIGPERNKGFLGFFAAWWLLKMLVTLVGALILCWLFKKQMQKLVRHNLVNFAPELLRGFVILVVLPIAVIISFVTIIGSMLGAAAMTLYILMVMIACVLAAISLGTWIAKLIFKGDYQADWRAVVIGTVLMTLIGFIPVVGMLFYFVFFLAAFGTLFNFLYLHFKEGEQ